MQRNCRCQGQLSQFLFADGDSNGWRSGSPIASEQYFTNRTLTGDRIAFVPGNAARAVRESHLQ